VLRLHFLGSIAGLDWADVASLLGEDSMHELELSWGRVLSVWWLIAWRGLVGSVLLGAAL